MRAPYEYYAKYLLITDPEHARDRLMRDGCPYDDTTWDDLVLRLGKPPAVKNPPSAKALTFAREQQVYSLLTKPDSEGFKTCFRILRQFHLRQALELLLVMNLTDESLCNLFLEGTGVQLDEYTLKLYRHYFWNTAILSRLDWYHFLHAVAGTAVIPRYPNGTDLWAAMHIDPELALAKMGYQRYASLDKAKALDSLFTTAYIKAQEEAAIGNTLGFQKASSVAIQAYESAKTSTTDVGQLLDKLAGRVRMTALKMEVLPLEKHTEGRHSEVSNVVPLLPKRSTDAHDGKDQP